MGARVTTPQLGGLTGWGWWCSAEASRRACRAGALASSASVRYLPKTARLPYEAATGTEDEVGIDSAQICANSTKPVLYRKASSSDGRGYTPASDASALLGDLSQGQRHGLSVEGATAPRGESNRAAYRLRKGQDAPFHLAHVGMGRVRPFNRRVRGTEHE